MIYESLSEKDTFELGVKLGTKAKPGQIVCIDGDLGVGKTVFTKGFAKGLGVEEDVVSPTFTIIQEYTDGKIPFYHLTFIELVIQMKCMILDMKNISLARECA